MPISVLEATLRTINMSTRMPFKFGITNLTRLPHLFVEIDLNVDGVVQRGVSADGLVPKWFTKDPTSDIKDDLNHMLAVIRSACGIARDEGDSPSPFNLWHRIYLRQKEWASRNGHPPLLANFGVSLVERAIIDAFCRAKRVSFEDAVRKNLLGINLGEIRSELSGFEPSALLPAHASRHMNLRHTIGMADPLCEGDISESDRVNDGLPQSLERIISQYNLRYFKVKICGDAQKDFDRLERIAGVLASRNTNYAFTLDGNEQYHGVSEFREFWESLNRQKALAGFMSKLLFVEQPLHRDVALSDETMIAMREWKDCPPTIIDESDSQLESLPRALSMGYCGTSHKNCKGVFKGLSNACLIVKCRADNPGKTLVLSAEDLTTVGPVSLLQDLAVVATLGLEHVERNGHHYFAGLSMFPDNIQSQMLNHHGDLYRRHERGFPTVHVADGTIELGSVVSAPFGVGWEPDLSAFEVL